MSSSVRRADYSVIAFTILLGWAGVSSAMPQQERGQFAGRKHFRLHAKQLEHLREGKHAEEVRPQAIEQNPERPFFRERIKDTIRSERQNNVDKAALPEPVFGADFRQRRLTQEEKMALRKQIRDARRDIYLQRMDQKSERRPGQN